MDKKLTVKDLVNKVIAIYMKEDYDYVITLAKRGEKPVSGVSTINERIEFIKNNNLIPDGSMTDIELSTAAKLIHDEITKLDNEIYSKYCGIKMEDKIDLSNQRRDSVILVGKVCHDLYIINNIYYICVYGTLEILAKMTKEFYESITDSTGSFDMTSDF